MRKNIAEGQVWTYKSRESEKESRVTIIKIDDLEKNIIIHIRIDGIKLVKRMTGEVIATSVEHLPISFDMFKKSVCKIEGTVKIAINEGYLYWKRLFANGEAGIWAVEIANAIEMTEETYQ